MCKGLEVMEKIARWMLCVMVGLLIVGCTAEATPTEVDGETKITEMYQTVEGMLTSTAASQPTATMTPTPTATATPTQPPTATTAPTQAAAAPAPAANAGVVSVSYTACDVAGFVADVTIPDNTVIDGGETFTKTWSLRNDGSCTWTSDYELVFYSGSQMGGVDSQELTDEDISPGETLYVTVDLVAPTTAGTYIGYWILQNASGVNFGIGSAAEAFYVQIVVDTTVTSTPTLTPTATDEDEDEATATPTLTPTATTASEATATATSAPTATTEPTATTAPTSTTAPTDTPAPAATTAPTDTPVPTTAPTEIPTASS